jgi:hypothetical protein
LQSNDKLVGIPFIMDIDRNMSYKGLEAVVRNRAYQLAATHIQPLKRQLALHEENGLTDVGVDWQADPQELAIIAETNQFVAAKLQMMMAVKQNITLQQTLNERTVVLTAKSFKGKPIVLNTKDKGAKIQLPELMMVSLTWAAPKRSDLDRLATTARVDVTDHDPNAVKNVTMTGNAPSLTLSDTIKAFSSPERLGSNDMWYCPKCKEHQRAMKELSLWRLPDNLIVHLKRFSWRNIVFRDKLKHFVDYPHTLNTAELLPDDHPEREAAAAAEPYELYGVVRHYGSLAGGHYVAMAKHATTHKWSEYNDTFVKPAQADEAVHDSGYLLMYRKPSSVAQVVEFSSTTADHPFQGVLEDESADHTSVLDLDGID